MKRRWWRHYVPNTSSRFSLVSTSSSSSSSPDLRAHWPIRLTQLVGGRRWSLSLVWHRTPHPVPTADPRPCRGRNSNVCVAEGCYGEACIKAKS